MSITTKILTITTMLVNFYAQALFAAETNFTVDIRGYAFQLSLVENEEFKQKISTPTEQITATYYTGQVDNIDGSWARMSNIDGDWQGVISIYGEMFIVEQGVVNEPNVLGAQMRATSMTQQGEQMGSCGAEGHSHSVLENVSQNVSQTFSNDASQSTLAATFSEFCSREVNGICVIAEVEVAFDLQFQALFPGQATAQALSILNIVDGHYENDLRISIDAITVTMLNNDLFDVTTNASALLDDIESKKNNGQIPFITNNNAITHLVTGRDLDGNTLGIAFLGSVCRAGGSNTGLSSVPRIGGVPNSTFTAVVVAHELGHNLGSIHDGPLENAACPANQFIMSPGLGLGITNFSACSALDIETTLSALTNPSLCLDFPADLILTENPGNNGSLGDNDEFTLAYTVTLNEGFAPISQVDISGDLDLAQAQFVEVSASGQPCLVAANGETYTCNVTNLPATDTQVDLLVDVSIAQNATALLLAQNTTNVTANIQDLMPANNTLMSQFAIAGGEITSLAGADSLTPPPSSPSPNNGGGAVSSDDDDSGGGGGAMEWYWLIILFTYYLFARRSEVIRI